MTAEITGGMKEMAKGAMAIYSAVVQVSELSGKNHNGINTLIDEVSRFKVE